MRPGGGKEPGRDNESHVKAASLGWKKTKASLRTSEGKARESCCCSWMGGRIVPAQERALPVEKEPRPAQASSVGTGKAGQHLRF